MSISYCPHCQNAYDQDTNVEHEEICKDEQQEIIDKHANWFKDMTKHFDNKFMEAK